MYRRIRLSGLVLLMVITLMLGACRNEPEYMLSGGGGLGLSQGTGKWVFINYWAEWCTPCRTEIPELNALYAILGERKILLLGVNYDGLKGDKLVAVRNRMNIQFPVLIEDPRKTWALDLPQVLPTTLVISPEGKLVAELVGPQTEASLIAAMRVN